MAKVKEKTPLTRENWIANFNLIGEAVIKNPEYTYKINERSEKSAWIYNSLNLGVDCGEKCGIVYAELMGGYSDERQNIIYAHGKKDDGSDDFSNRIEVAWEDRFNEEVLAEIGEMCFITVGLEKTNKGKTYYKKFLSAYDAIKYVEENLEDGMVINVKGNLKYSTYQDNTQVRKEITSIVLSGAERDKYAARFTQSILIDKDSTDLKALDKDKGVIYVNARVLDYVKEMNGLEIKGQYPFPKEFEYAFADISNGERCKKAYNGLFKVKKGVTMITFDGEFIESGATVTMTLADLPDDIQELVVIGISKDSVASHKKFEEKYSEDDLIFDFPDNNPEDELDEITPDDDLSFDFDNGDSDSTAESKADSSDGLDWLNDL